MKYTIIVQSHMDSPGAYSALKFSSALLEREHQIECVFFYGDATCIANSNITPAQDETNIHEAWASFIGKNSIRTVTCIAAALKRGMLDDSESERYEKPNPTVTPPYELGGLGQLIEATHNSDRTISFR